MALNIEELEGAARELLPRDVYDYYAGAAWDGVTLRENRAAYARLAIHYRILRDVSARSTACELFGARLAMPILAAPTAFHRLACPEGEVATARGVGAAGTLMTLSSLATCRLEDVAAAATGPLWFQLYINKDRGFTRELVARAVAAGYRAIVVTADTPCWGVRENDLRNGFHLPEGVEPVNLMPSGAPGDESRTHRGSGMAEILSWMLDLSLTWRDLEWLAAEAGVPVLVKGVCRPEDAREALRHGAAGVIVSNHGGRQLDSAPATISVLPGIVEAVAGAAPVLIDGGIRRGTDVLKALALGARAVLVGRPVLWGLATGGAGGVAQALTMLQRELDLAMALAGCASLAEITPDLVKPVV
jgi:4-hydroxymandelate oxidase